MKRILAIILAVVMTLNVLPMTTYADTNLNFEVVEDTKMSILSEETINVEEFSKVNVDYGEEYSYLTFTIEDTSVATVSNQSLRKYIEITGCKRGQTTMTVKTRDGIIETYTINVIPKGIEIESTPYGNEVDRDEYSSTDYIKATQGFKEYTWTVSDESVLKLGDYGTYEKKVVPINKGTAVVTVTNEYGESAQCTITVVADEFELDYEKDLKLSVKVGETKDIDIPSSYDWDECTVSIGNSKVASYEVKSWGCYITGLKLGTTTLTVTNKYGEVATCTINVCAELTKLEFKKEEYIIWMGNPVKISYNVAPKKHNNTIYFDFRYGGSDIISVSEDGTITPLKAGTVTAFEIKSKESYKSDDCKIIVKNPYFTNKSFEVYTKQTLQLNLKGGRKDTKWKSSNTKIATVNSSGKVTAKKAGKVTITANTGGFKVKTTIKVVNPKLTTKKATVWTNESLKLEIIGGTGKVKWKSSDKKVATVNSSGKVTGKKAGTATISAKVSGVTLKCKITVKGPKISDTKKTLAVREIYQLSVKGAAKKIEWSSTDTNVAVVDSKGRVTAKQTGTTTIIAKTSGKTLKCDITVIRNEIAIDVNTDVTDYEYGSPHVYLSKAYFEGDVLKIDLWILNNRRFTAVRFDWIKFKLTDKKGNLIAENKFTNVSLNVAPFSAKKITLTYTSDMIKNPHAVLNNGVDYDWKYYYTYSIN